MRLWRRSLQLRVLATTLALSVLAVAVTGVIVSVTVANNLFQSQLDRVLETSARATAAAESVLDSSDASDPSAVQSVSNVALRSATATSASDLFALYRVPDQEFSPIALQDRVSTGLSGEVISDELRAAVQADPDGQYWQSVSLRDASGASVPGIVVGSQIQLPSTAGAYELYLGFRLAEAASALSNMQAIGVVGAIVLLAMLTGVTLLTVRWVLEPIRRAAETSQQLANGALEVRLPAHGEDEIATLARSFNGMADSMQAQITELAELSTMQQRFVSDVSHELRTPLTTIRLAGDVLHSQRDDFDPTTARTVELLHTQTDRFEELLGDLLEISRYDAGSVQLDVEPTNLVRLAESVVEGFATLAEGRGSRLEVRAPGGYFDADVDPRRIRRIIRNLVGNAIEHGEGREIIVSVDSNATAVAVAVRDFGIGMSEAERERVFDRFWRADPARTRTIGGTGLGLAISLEDAFAHGGTIELWSEPGEGSNFVLVLPRRPGAPRSESPIPLDPRPAESGDKEPSDDA